MKKLLLSLVVAMAFFVPASDAHAGRYRERVVLTNGGYYGRTVYRPGYYGYGYPRYYRGYGYGYYGRPYRAVAPYGSYYAPGAYYAPNVWVY